MSEKKQVRKEVTLKKGPKPDLIKFSEGYMMGLMGKPSMAKPPLVWSRGWEKGCETREYHLKHLREKKTEAA